MAGAALATWFGQPVMERARDGNRWPANCPTARISRLGQRVRLARTPRVGPRARPGPASGDQAGRTGPASAPGHQFPDDFNAKIAMEQLGGNLAEEGRLAEAERALRETLRMCAQSPAARSGTSGRSRICPRRSALSGQGGGGPVRAHRRGCLGPCRDRCHLQVVSSGNGAVGPVPRTVEVHGTAHGGTRLRPGTGEHHDQELSSRCDEGLRCRA